MTDQLHRFDKIATWSGVCHGWAPASIQLNRPEKSFVVRGAAGHDIRFYPSDVKALSSFLWGKSYAQNFVKVKGWQCKGRRVRRDFNGRLTDDKCFDVNPAFVFLSMVGQIGISRSSVIIDRSYDDTVQNQPVFRYQYKYVRLSNGVTTDHLDRAILRRGSFRDPFGRYRSPRTQYLVGVELKVWYTKETDPSHAETDSADQDRIYDLKMNLSLELDSSRRIVGGEWHELGWDADRPSMLSSVNYVHPDILWVVPKDLKAWSTTDADLGEAVFDPAVAQSPEWKTAIHKAATLQDPEGSVSGIVGEKVYRPQPMTKIVDFLLEKSKR